MGANFVLLLFLLVEAIVPLTGTFVGSLTETPVSDPDAQHAAHFAVQAYNDVADSLFYIREVKLIRAQKQIVQGTMYVLTMELAVTKCQKNLPSDDLEKCQIPPENHLECEFEVWSHPWLKMQKLTSFSCKPIMA